MESEMGIGVLGCGGFGLFALQQFAQIPGVRLVAMAATHRPAAQAAAKRFDIIEYDEPEKLVEDQNVDLVYIATPPFLHYPQAMLALRAGKHVICEKPLALSVAQADEMIAESRFRDKLLVTNLMQRYNPLYEKIRRLIKTQALGEVLHGFFENYAADESLTEDHWFWDREKSGGIFIEHGVHFFDLFAGWLGKGSVIASQSCKRQGSGIEDQVQCTVGYPGSTLVNFYHGFHQPHRLDRQELRILFERGDLTLFDWVPTRMRIRGIVNELDTHALCDIFPNIVLDVITLFGGGERACRGHGKVHDVYQSVEMRWEEGRGKYPLYCQLLRAMLEDQMAWIDDHCHPRVITEENGRESLKMACEATQMAVNVAT